MKLLQLGHPSRKFLRVNYCFFLDIPSIVISTNATKYLLVGTGIIFTCRFLFHIHLFSDFLKIKLLKDGTPFYQWKRRYHWYNYSVYTPVYSARQNHTGKYQCKVSIGAASRYSFPFYLTIGGNFQKSSTILVIVDILYTAFG